MLFLVFLTFAILQITPDLVEGSETPLQDSKINYFSSSRHETDIPTETWTDKLENAWNEVVNVSPLACVLIILPLSLCFLFCVCVTCICVSCCKARKKRRRSCTKSTSSRVVVKSPEGQPEPIPLMGLVHQSQNGFHPLRPVPGGHHPAWSS